MRAISHAEATVVKLESLYFATLSDVRCPMLLRCRHHKHKMGETAASHETVDAGSKVVSALSSSTQSVTGDGTVIEGEQGLQLIHARQGVQSPQGLQLVATAHHEPNSQTQRA